VLDRTKTLSPADVKDTAVRNQQTLEVARDLIVQCVTIQTSLLGDEVLDAQRIQERLTIAQAKRDSVQGQYLKYVKTGSPLVDVLRDDLRSANNSTSTSVINI
jgi:hypothetical protein